MNMKGGSIGQNTSPVRRRGKEFRIMEKGLPLPKFGEWDVNDPASAEGFTVIFNKARNEKRTGGKPESPPKSDSEYKHRAVLGKPQSERHSGLRFAMVLLDAEGGSIVRTKKGAG
nr:RPM1-interacting protein 4-like [Ipomoea batatas]GMC77018.1 RPM1-interacting protein 4-like [Ipomoea batatas]